MRAPLLLPASERPKSTVPGALAGGWRRALHAPALTVGVWILTLSLTTPLLAALGGLIERRVGSGFTPEGRAVLWDPEWTVQFAAASTEPGRTFAYEILGFGGTVAALGRVFDRSSAVPALTGALAAHFVLSVFLTGGILDRLARGRRVGAAGFFTACGGHLARLVRLNLLLVPCYWALFAWVHPFLFHTVYGRVMFAAGSAQVEALWRALFLVLFAVALVALNMVADFSKLRAVVEDRRSALGSLAAGARFVRRRFLRVGWLYLLNIGAQLAIALVWLGVAPSSASPVWLALAVGQFFLVIRLLARLAFLGSGAVFFQHELAHAGYTAEAEPVWPDSPAVEAIRNRARLIEDRGSPQQPTKDPVS